LSAPKRALICGITGQDGGYLAKLLVDKGYHVIGTSRDAQVASLRNLERLGVRDKVEVVSMALTDFRSVLQVLASSHPDEVYNLAGQTSVGLSFSQPVETTESIGGGTLNLLEAMRFLGKPVRLYNAGSSECFGDTPGKPADESTPFHPRSPYAVAKSTAHWLIANYREAYNLYACTGILFNHESVVRPERFVTMKIVKAAARIARGSGETLKLGNMGIARDWGWAEEYVNVIWRMLQMENPRDLVIATGETTSLQDFTEAVFAEFGLDWRDHVVSDPALGRPSDITVSAGDPTLAEQLLGWRASVTMRGVVQRLTDAEKQAGEGTAIAS
jgi:GDPmannose 4,6-dehydratase